MQGAFPEVAQLVRTVQLSHKILFKKGAFIAELAQTGEASNPAVLRERSERSCYVAQPASTT